MDFTMTLSRGGGSDRKKLRISCPSAHPDGLLRILRVCVLDVDYNGGFPRRFGGFWE
jgi:hypothetical protein